jgi:uncharacterized protein
MMKPWREVVVPHKDVLEGTFQQSEFAADITAVQRGKAPREYQDATAFFERTFITEGMRQLLTQVAQRLSGYGGEPVIQLQTAFGGGKTHTMLAVYHLATRKTPLSDLSGIPALIDAAGLMGVPQARVAVLDGTALAPGQPWKHASQTIHTLWGELAWQLGGSEAFALVKKADETGTSPGKEVLRDLLAQYAPCVVLIDELVAWIRQFPEGQPLSGGSYDSNLSFVQALTEAAKLVPTAMVLASLPESEVEAGSQRGGIAALKALEKTFGRVQALWKPIATEEAFEIVRRRLFEPVQEVQTRNLVCQKFAETYRAEGARLPAETQEHRYVERLVQAYPIHPEIFDRLYEDWTTIDGFQRTRGVLKLMAKVIYRLWKDENKDLMILPGSLPLDDSGSRNELTYYLPPGWDAVIEGDIDGERAETTELETREPRFGQIHAARRVARTLFLGSAPSSVATTLNIRGLDRARILLGCLQPEQPSSVYLDALNRLADRLHYLNSSDDKAKETTRFWFDTRANLRREMEDRKRRFDDKTELRNEIATSVKRTIGNAAFFEGVHVFISSADVPDDSALRLVVLLPSQWYAREEARLAEDAVRDYVRQHGTQPRYRRNRLLFLAADQGVLVRLHDATRTTLAWQSIVDDIKEGRLTIDNLQTKQAEKELQSAKDALPRIVRECFCWLLCPVQDTATNSHVQVEAFRINPTGTAIGNELERACRENELVIDTWSPIHLRETLKELYWKEDKTAVRAMDFWEDTLRYLYLPRLINREVLINTIRNGAASKDFFGTAYGQFEDRFDGFQFGQGTIQVDDTLLLIEPNTAKAFEQRTKKAAESAQDYTVHPPTDTPVKPSDPSTDQSTTNTNTTTAETSSPAPPRARSFHGSAEVPAPTVKMRLTEIAEEIVAVLSQDPNADIKIVVEISAEFSEGASDSIKRAVTENARILGLKTADWE